jgi:hypothetical protein
VAGGAGGTGSASIIQSGIALCQFDGTSFAAGDYVVPSSSASTAGECHDQGVANTAGTQPIGVVAAAPGSGSLANVVVFSIISSPGALSINTAPITTGNSQIYITAPIPDPGAAATPTSITQHGTSGSTTYGYEVAAELGCCSTLAGTELKTTTGYNPLGTSNYNIINWNAFSPVATAYLVYRTTAGGTGNSGQTGLVGSVAAAMCSTTCTINDEGAAAFIPPSVVNATGYVGVGTTSPTRTLEVHTNVPGESSDFLFQNDNTSVGAGSGFLISTGATTSGVTPTLLGGVHAVLTSTGNLVQMWEWVSGAVDNVVSLNGGYVGINTASPTATLDLSGSLAVKYVVATSSPYTIQATDNVVYVYVAASPFTVTLPACTASPVSNDSVEYTVKDSTGNAGTHNITINVASASGNTIEGGGTSLVINSAYGYYKLQCTAGSGIWYKLP